MKYEIGNYTLTEKYHAPCILYKDGEDVMEFTFDDLEEALSNMLYFAWEDKMFHGTTEFKQSTAKTAPKKYREILENRCPNIGFMKLNAEVITGQK